MLFKPRVQRTKVWLEVDARVVQVKVFLVVLEDLIRRQMSPELKYVYTKRCVNQTLLVILRSFNRQRTSPMKEDLYEGMQV